MQFLDGLKFELVAPLKEISFPNGVTINSLMTWMLQKAEEGKVHPYPFCVGKLGHGSFYPFAIRDLACYCDNIFNFLLYPLLVISKIRYRPRRSLLCQICWLEDQKLILSTQLQWLFCAQCCWVTVVDFLNLGSLPRRALIILTIFMCVVLVSSSCCNKLLQAQCLRAMNIYFLTASEIWSNSSEAEMEVVELMYCLFCFHIWVFGFPFLSSIWKVIRVSFLISISAQVGSSL